LNREPTSIFLSGNGEEEETKMLLIFGINKNMHKTLAGTGSINQIQTGEKKKKNK